MKTLFNDGWKFAKIHLDSPDASVDPAAFADSLFENDFSPVAVPHDWLIFDTENLYENSVGVYSKDFSVPGCASRAGLLCSSDRFFLRFDGVYMDTTIFINGAKAFEWKYGYTTFEFDISPFVHAGINNIKVVSVYRCPNSRWYSGAGIFRNVWFVKVPAAHLVSDGIYASSRLSDKESGTWKLDLRTETVFHSPIGQSSGTAGSCSGCTELSNADGLEVVIRHTVSDKAGNVVATGDFPRTLRPVRTESDSFWFLRPENTDSSESAEWAQLTVCGIKPWDIESPELYTLKTELLLGDNVLDFSEQKIGFRSVYFDNNKGFFLNGRHVKINGVCLHHDLGALGSAFNRTAARRQLQKMIDMGVNSIRTSHNPTDPQFLDLCDEMGLLVDSEGFDMWGKCKTPYDYGNYFEKWHQLDTASWIRRDRNHPCVFMWSIGNEIYDTHQGNGLEEAKELVKIVRISDPYKNGYTTIGSNYIEWDGAQRCMEEVELAGYNYGERLYEAHHQKHPAWCIYGSETSSTVQSRGVYHFPASFRTLTHDDMQCSSLGNCSSNWGAVTTEDAITNDRDTAFSFGQYIWSGWDYIGEPTPFFTKNSFFGQVDTAGFAKDTFYLFQSAWTDWRKKPMVHLLPYWDFNPGQMIDIKAYTNAPKVELFLNGVSLGLQSIDHAAGKPISGRWQTEFVPGVIEAVAYDDEGNELCRDSQQSFGDGAKIVLKADKIAFASDAEDLIFVEISLADSDGVPVANARNRMNVSVEGAVLMGLDNGDSTDYEQYKCSSRRLFNNGLVAILAPDLSQAGKAHKARICVDSAGFEKAVLEFDVPGIVLPAGASDMQNQCCTKPAKVGTGGKTHCQPADEVPVRKIELVCDGDRALSPDNREVTVTARIYPENATCTKLFWRPCRLEGIASPAAKIIEVDTQDKVSAVSSDAASLDAASLDACALVRTVTVQAAGDGEFRLRAWCCNNTEDPEGKDLPQVVSELEFSVSGMGQGTINPYELVSACQYSSALVEPKLSFQGGMYILAGGNYLTFENVDFGPDGSDTFELPIFSFDTELPVALWDGIPDKGGTLLFEGTYKSDSWYNHYQSNTWTMNRRLCGVHTISVAFETRLSLQGIRFVPGAKAFAHLNALDNNRITGDSFQLAPQGINRIGNNVSVEFEDMDFGEKGAAQIAITGRAVNGTNTMHVKFDSPDGSSQNCIVEIPKTEEACTHEFRLEGIADNCIKGAQKVTFVFLPGSCFDFEGFQFS